MGEYGQIKQTEGLLSGLAAGWSKGPLSRPILTKKSLGFSKRRYDSQHPLKRSIKTPENPRTRDPRRERSNLLTLNLL